MPTKDEITEVIKTIIDPELFIDIWTLGLIYDIAIAEEKVDVKMTFTSMACPAGPQLVSQVKEKVLTTRFMPEMATILSLVELGTITSRAVLAMM